MPGAYLGDLTERLSLATAAKHYRSQQQLFRWLVENGEWLVEDGEIAGSPWSAFPPAVPEQPVPVITEDELSRLLTVRAGDTFENRRDAAIIRLLLDTGMRAGE